MKYAPLLAGSALVLLLVALATANPFTPLRKVVPLDFTGIDTLVVHGTSPQIQISSAEAAEASYIDETDKTLSVHRAGNRLLIAISSEGYLELKLNVPPSVRDIVVHGGNIVAKERLQSMQVSTSNGVTWEGDIARLDLRDTIDHSSHASDHCGCGNPTFTVSDGHIAELLVRSSEGDLELWKPEKIDAVYAWLGQKGGVSLHDARRFDNIHLLSAEAQLPVSVDAAPASGP